MEETQQPKKGNWKRVVQIIILVAAIAVCAVSIYNIVAITTEDQESNASTEKMRSYVTRNTGTEKQSEATPAETAEAQPTPTGQLPAEQTLDIDFEGLREINPEVIAWIDIPGTDISYPVVQSEDKNYYLDYSADGTPNRAGAIFVDYRNASDFSEHNTIVYGHRMNNGSMFGNLNLYTDPEYAAEHPYVYIYVPGEENPRVYEVFSSRETSAKLESDAYRLDFPSDGEFLEWTEVLREDGSWLEGTEFEADDVIVTLSTCVRGDASNRFVVEAKRVS